MMFIKYIFKVILLEYDFSLLTIPVIILYFSILYIYSQVK
jgi:hypothetical protein